MRGDGAVVMLITPWSRAALVLITWRGVPLRLERAGHPAGVGHGVGGLPRLIEWPKHDRLVCGRLLVRHTSHVVGFLGMVEKPRAVGAEVIQCPMGSKRVTTAW
jgi:hypothetical protein